MTKVIRIARKFIDSAIKPMNFVTGPTMNGKGPMGKRPYPITNGPEMRRCPMGTDKADTAQGFRVHGNHGTKLEHEQTLVPRTANSFD